MIVSPVKHYSHKSVETDGTHMSGRKRFLFLKILIKNLRESNAPGSPIDDVEDTDPEFRYRFPYYNWRIKVARGTDSMKHIREGETQHQDKTKVIIPLLDILFRIIMKSTNLALWRYLFRKRTIMRQIFPVTAKVPSNSRPAKTKTSCKTSLSRWARSSSGPISAESSSDV